jgi:hypothetical protein
MAAKSGLICRVWVRSAIPDNFIYKILVIKPLILELII